MRPAFRASGALVGNRRSGLDRPRRRSAQTSYPMTLCVEPIAVSRGQTVEITISGRENFSGAWKLLCEGPGLRGEVQNVEKVDAQDQGQARRSTATRNRPGSSPARSRSATHHLARASCGWPHPRESRASGLVVVVDGPVIVEADDRWPTTGPAPHRN